MHTHVRSREEINQESRALSQKIIRAQWCVGAAMLSPIMILVGICIESWYVIILGLAGMVGFGGYMTCLSEREKELRQVWRARGYGFSRRYLPPEY